MSRSLELAGAWLQALTDGSKEVVALIGPGGAVQFLGVASSVHALVGIDPVELVSGSPLELVHPSDRQRVEDAYEAVQGHPGGRVTVEYRVRHRTGRYLLVESTAVNRLPEPHIAALVVHTREIPLGHAPAAPTEGEAPISIANQDQLVRALNVAIKRSRQGVHSFSVLVLTVDRIDALAESMGDRLTEDLLTVVGKRLNALLRPGDMLARLEGQRFAILLDEVGDRHLAERIADRIQKTVGTRFQVGERHIRRTTALGIATSDRAYEKAADIIRDATIAAANAGANSTGDSAHAVFRTQMGIDHGRRQSLEGELVRALDRDQLCMHYLPIVSLATRTLVGFEALARWEHPGRGVILPHMFIPVAEQSRLMKRLARRLLEHATRDMNDWRRRYELDPPLQLHVHLSPKQFADFDAYEEITGVLKRADFDPSDLVVELDERALLEHPDAVVDTLGRLRTVGVRTAMDNFGAGTSSLTQLHRLPFDYLKIDRRLTSNLGVEGEARQMVRGIVAMAHQMSLQVVAEGVEKPVHAAQLGSMLCEFAQGHLFGRALDRERTGAFIASYPQWWQG